MDINTAQKVAKDMLWRSGNLRWKLHPQQQQIYDELTAKTTTGHKTFAFRCARQFGKSFLTVIMALELCLKHPNIIVRIAGPTLTSIADIVEDNLAPITADAPPGLIVREKSSNRYRVGSSSLRLGTVERAHVDKTMRGGNAFAIFVEEAAASVKSADLSYAMRSVINPQLLRSSKRPGGGLLGFITTPADSPEHYFHTDIEPACQAAGTYFMRTVYDNPQLTPDQISIAMARCGGSHSEDWRREYLCELFRSEEVVIVPEFNPDLHVKEFTLPEHRRLYTAIDLGGSRDHHHAILYYYDFLNATINVYADAHAPAHTSTPELIALIEAMEAFDSFGPVRRYADLNGQTATDLLRVYNFQAETITEKHPDADLNFLRNLFSQNKLLIHPRCQATIQCLIGARWNKQRTDWERTEQLGHCDAIAALVYACRRVDYSDPQPKPKQSDIEAALRPRTPSGLQRWANTLNNTYKKGRT